MGFFANLRALWRNPRFRKLILVRLTAQTGDGVLQVAMASYILFSAENQTTAWAIAMVLAITLLPFSIVGPFVSVFLDRWPRRPIVVGSSIARAMLCLVMALMIGAGQFAFWYQTILFILLLIANSFNRFLLAALVSGLSHTIHERGYLVASSVMPLLGPIGLLVGGVVAVGLRVGTKTLFATHLADAISMLIATALVALSAVIAASAQRLEWGPTREAVTQARSSSLRQSLSRTSSDIIDSFQYLGRNLPIRWSLIVLGVQRICFGMNSVAMILATKNLFHSPDNANSSLLDTGLWLVASALGYVIAPLVVNPVSRVFRVHRAIVVFLALSGISHLIPGIFLAFIPQVITGLIIGITAQGIRILADTVVQSHCDEDYKGRVFVVYDIIYNTAMVVAGVIAGFVMSPQGLSYPIVAALAASYLLTALWAWASGHRIGSATFDRGTDLPTSTDTTTA